MPLLSTGAPYGIAAGGGGGGASTNTWNPSDKHSDITLSGGNLIATRSVGSGTWRGGRGVNGYSSGKFYIEAVCITSFASGSDCLVGLANLSAAIDNYVGPDNNSIGWLQDGRVHRNNANQGSISAFGTINDNCGMAWDFGVQKVWFRKNGGNWNNNGTHDPAANVGGFDFSAVTGTLYNIYSTTTVTQSLQLVPSSADWTYAAPSGFGQT